MSQEERYGTRDLTYSRWHRRDSIYRFVGWERAQTLSMIDIDIPIYLEYDDQSKEPLILCEVATDIGQSIKPATITRRLAMRSDLPAFTVLYQRSGNTLEADPRFLDIDYFRVKKIWPYPEGEWCNMTPERYALWIVDLRARQAANVIPQTDYLKNRRWPGTQGLICPFCGLNYGGSNGG